MKTTKTKILILRLSSIGDILLSTAFIRQTRIKFPSAKIDFVIKNEFFDLIRYNPHINYIYQYDSKSGLRGLLRLRKKINNQNYDYIFDIHNNFRTKIITSRIKSAKKWKIKKNKLIRALLVYTKINLYKNIKPIPFKYLDAGKAARIKDDFQGLEIFWKDYIENIVDTILYKKNIRYGYLIIAPGAGFYTKRWPVEYFKKLIEKITDRRKEKIIIVGGKSEINDFNELEISRRVVNLTGKLNLLEAAALINKAKAVVSNDSGLMHIAAAVKTPVLAIFGSSVKELGFFPFRSECIALENNNIKCRPCSHIGRSRCPLGHFKCMKEIDVDVVYNNLLKILKDSV
jgi:heptosyltransferase-2